MDLSTRTDSQMLYVSLHLALRSNLISCLTGHQHTKSNSHTKSPSSQQAPSHPSSPSLYPTTLPPPSLLSRTRSLPHLHRTPTSPSSQVVVSPAAFLLPYPATGQSPQGPFSSSCWRATTLRTQPCSLQSLRKCLGSKFHLGDGSNRSLGKQACLGLLMIRVCMGNYTSEDENDGYITSVAKKVQEKRLQ